jgi:hypothetical protein
MKKWRVAKRPNTYMKLGIRSQREASQIGVFLVCGLDGDALVSSRLKRQPL